MYICVADIHSNNNIKLISKCIYLHAQRGLQYLFCHSVCLSVCLLPRFLPLRAVHNYMYMLISKCIYMYIYSTVHNYIVCFQGFFSGCSDWEAVN